jgi:methylmalonyl-CoA/ethylmalonyl-CoA epimerase
MIKIDHIGIAVKNLSTSISVFEALMATACYKVEEVDSEKVTTAFLKNGETKIELIEGAEPDGVIARFIEKKGEGMHHIAFESGRYLRRNGKVKKRWFHTSFRTT